MEMVGESVLLVRNREGRIRAFYNVCRHRGSRLCRTPEQTAALRVALPGGITAGRMIVCPYHQWSYDLNGALIAAPHMNAVEDFNKQDFHLYPIDADSWGGFVFLNLTPAEAKPLAAQLGGIPERLQRYPLGDITTSAITAAEFTRNFARWCPRSARPAAPILIGAVEFRIAKAPILLRTAEPPRGAPSLVSMRTNNYGTRANWCIPICS
jgi:Rieske 2Fe-2S family protein